MPIYVYGCSACGARREVFLRRMDTTAPVRCERCDVGAMARLPAAFALQKDLPSTLSDLDPSYHQRIDDAIARTPEADPMRLLNRMTPFSAADAPGDPLPF